MAIKLITDCTSDIEPELAKSLDIEILSSYINFNGESIKKIDIDNATFYSRMEKEGIPTT